MAIDSFVTHHATLVSPELPTLGKYQILVTEDEADQRELLLWHLKTWGLHGIGAKDGQEALAILSQDDSVRLLITDLKMPGMDGLELLRQLKESGRRLYSIVLSGVSDRRTLINTLRAGATDYMVKPCHPEQLFARLAVLDKIMALEEEHQALIRDLFDVMGEMLGSRDSYTLDHSLRVAAISVRTGRHMGLSKDDLDILELGCLVHDIGKIAIPDDVLLKPGRFDRLDRKIMNMHPTIGARFLATRYPDDRVTEIVLYHHERLDGSGYPQGLKGEDIPKLVRIVAVADVYEALVAQRPYKSPLKKERAIKILEEEVSEGKLDKDVVDALKAVLEYWDPLVIKRSSNADVLALESFRRITYFKEPLCSFYNYRYLLARRPGEGLCGNRVFYLVLIGFKNLREMNQKVGYLKADQLLDEIGEEINVYLTDFNKKYAHIQGDSLLCRKGADYLIYLSYPQDLLEEVQENILHILKKSEEQWGIGAKIISKEFPSACSLEEALDTMLYIDPRENNNDERE